jgi:hypothetical protein
VPARIDIYETFNPGAVTAVSVFTPEGREQTVWQGVDPTPVTSDRGTSRIPVQVGFKTQRVKIYINSPAVPGWNEIDAVGLVDGSNKTQWASAAQASTTYAAASSTGSVAAALIPPWSGLSQTESTTPSAAQHRLAAGFGWPFITLCCGQEIVSPAQTHSWGLIAGSLTPATGMKRAVALPYRPVWFGLLLNALFYALVLIALRPLMILPRRILREWRRMRRGRCLACGYDLRFDFARGCPECGWRREAASTAETATDAHASTEN